MLRRLICQATFRHKGSVNSDSRGVFWRCHHCGHRIYTGWEEL